MARMTRNDITTGTTPKRRQGRSEARELLRDFERQYIAANKDSQIYL